LFPPAEGGTLAAVIAMTRQTRWDADLFRLLLVTDGRGDLVRLETVVGAAIEGGVRVVQLREPHWSARLLLQGAERLRPLLDAVGGLLFVNDRLDVALTGVAHGVQLGHRSLPPDLARGIVGDRLLLGFSAHDQAELDLAAAAGCDVALLSPVWATESKPGMPFLGEGRAAGLTAAARLPVVWLGGVTATHAARAADLPAPHRPVGIAVRSGIMSSSDPRYAAQALRRAFGGSGA
jgi:thiamine-phosphate pyrophosphorylase